MRTLLLVSLGFLLTCSALAQGTITWTTPTNPITTNGLGNSGPISGAGNYRFGIYVGPSGSSAGSLTLVALTTNSALAGAIQGGSFVLPVGFPNGTPIAFQFRGWSSFAGPSYEAALDYALAGSLPIAFLGQSTLDSYVVGSPTPLRPEAFVLTPVPEPSTVALGALGLAALTVLSRRRDKRSR